jgi:hypothetical protein
LFTLAPTLPEPLKAEALTAVQAIQDQMRRTQVLCALAPTLLNGLQRETLFIEAVHLVHELVNTGPRNRSGLYCQIISSWGKQRFHGFQLQLWSETLHALARRPRNELLDDLAALVPLIEHLGGQSAIEDFFYALRDVTTWWP